MTQREDHNLCLSSLIKMEINNNPEKKNHFKHLQQFTKKKVKRDMNDIKIFSAVSIKHKRFILETFGLRSHKQLKSFPFSQLKSIRTNG